MFCTRIPRGCLWPSVRAMVHHRHHSDASGSGGGGGGGGGQYAHMHTHDTQSPFDILGACPTDSMDTIRKKYYKVCQCVCVCVCVCTQQH